MVIPHKKYRDNFSRFHIEDNNVLAIILSIIHEMLVDAYDQELLWENVL